MNNASIKRTQQIIRLEKLNSEDFYLLSKEKHDNKLVFNICGSTKNIYSVKLYFISKMIYCNCPDSKSWAKKFGVLCKHVCFVLFKVLKFNTDKDDYLRMLIFNEHQINEIKNNFDKLDITNYDKDYINKEYTEKFNKLSKIDTKEIIPRTHDNDNYCVICYEEFDNLTDKNLNTQCKICLKIFHKKCINKWTSLGNTSCPFCRSQIKKNNLYNNILD
jgi:hypothetical protein